MIWDWNFPKHEFKVGDKVKILVETSVLPQNSIGTIEGIDENVAGCPIRVRTLNKNNWDVFDEDELELII